MAFALNAAEPLLKEKGNMESSMVVPITPNATS